MKKLSGLMTACVSICSGCLCVFMKNEMWKSPGLFGNIKMPLIFAVVCGGGTTANGFKLSPG